jgi:hypothetical protein
VGRKRIAARRLQGVMGTEKPVPALPCSISGIAVRKVFYIKIRNRALQKNSAPAIFFMISLDFIRKNSV